MIDVTVQNAWLLHKKFGVKLMQCEFKEQLAETRCGQGPKGKGRPQSYPGQHDKRVLEDVRYDRMEHYFEETPGKK